MNLVLTDEARLARQIFLGVFCFLLSSGGILTVRHNTWHFLLGSMDYIHVFMAVLTELASRLPVRA